MVSTGWSAASFEEFIAMSEDHERSAEIATAQVPTTSTAVENLDTSCSHPSILLKKTPPENQPSTSQDNTCVICNKGSGLTGFYTIYMLQKLELRNGTRYLDID